MAQAVKYPSMDTRMLLAYKWAMNGTGKDLNPSFLAALDAAFLHFAAPDIAILGRERFFPPLIPIIGAFHDHVESAEAAPKPISGKATYSDTYLWTELHSRMSASGASETIMQYLYPLLRQKELSDQSLYHITVAAYVCASVLLYEGLILGRFYYIANECMDGKVFGNRQCAGA
ncbi:Thiol-disulfide isomerase and thioredoxin [Giardia duodenalis]|uniref:Thiol-disulfide isomerase and thioredoxin n=1 Tax=Giardia intestinalis TaxID=5741 RepID=V6TPL8_GIAIN|nr:Thiol-disulfide isomerase and thioredoxin [Giardia intestinalis]